MSVLNRVELERLRYWQGQMLRSRDFRDQGVMEAQLRAWHNRSLHSGYGISIGLTLSTVTDGGRTTVAVACGLAYDCYGRELIVTRSGAAPPIPGSLKRPTLVLRYSGNGPSGVELVWRERTELRISDGVRLGEFLPATNKLDLKDRYSSRPIARPRLATGQTVKGNTPWEPWNVRFSLGGRESVIAVGVETKIDTSAAGFTATPCYFANLQGLDWNSATDAFAPAFFTHIADPQANGFTFRILMLGIARRKIAVAPVTSRVTAFSAGVQIIVADPGAFRTGDVVTRLRARGRPVTTATIADKVLTLDAPLLDIRKGETILIGNLPRVAVVNDVETEDRTQSVQLEGAVNLPAGVLAARVTAGDEVKAVMIDDGKDDKVILRTSIKGLKTNDKLAVALPAAAVPLPSSKVTDVKLDGGVMRVEVEAPEIFKAGGVVFRTGTGVEPSTATIDKIEDGLLVLRSKFKKLVKGDILTRAQVFNVLGVEVLKRAMEVRVDNIELFREGDIVVRIDAGGTSLPTLVDSIEDDLLTLLTPLDKLIKGDQLGIVSRTASSLVVKVDAAGTGVTLKDVTRFRGGDFAAKTTAGSGPGTPTVIDSIAGQTILLRAPITGLVAGDLLIGAAFLHPAKVENIVTTPAGVFAGVDDTRGMREGDTVMKLGGSATEVTVVDATGNATLQLRTPIAGLMPGDRLAAVDFYSSARVQDFDPDTDPKAITIDRKLELRKGDVVSPLDAYLETSLFGSSIMAIGANTLTLDSGIDGLLPEDFIGVTSFTPNQNRLRLDGLQDLQRGDQLLLNGFDARTGLPGRFVGIIADIDPASSTVTLLPAQQGRDNFRFRPESLGVAATFNANFTTAFAAFAQRKELYVCWLGCQTELMADPGCPGSRTSADPCKDEPSPCGKKKNK